MKDLEIDNLLQVIYASNIVDHIFSGTAVSRAVRGHCIVDASLHSLLAAKVIGVTLPAENTDTDLSMESEDVATTSTDDATKDVESVSTEVTQSHDVQDLADLKSGETSTDDIEQNCIVSKTLAYVSFFLHAAVIPIPRNTKLNLSSSCNYRAIALSSSFSKILDKTIMPLQSEYLMTSELQFGFKEHCSTIVCSTLLVELLNIMYLIILLFMSY